MIVDLVNVRLAFPALVEPKAVNDGAAVYSAVFIVEPGSANAKALAAAVAQVAKEKWGAKAPIVLKSLAKVDKICYREDAKCSPTTGEPYAGFDGMHYVNASSKVRVPVVDRDPDVPLVAADGRPYAGCYVNARIDVWAQDNGFGQRINAGLGPVQFVGDGESFGGGTPMPVKGAFKNLDAGADADDMI